MKTKEKLERAGWLYSCQFGTNSEYEVFKRGDIRILYHPGADMAFAYYSVKDKNKELKILYDTDLDYFTEKL